MLKYFSQAGQDSIFKQFFEEKKVRNGFFLDVGSVDGIYISNTYLLEQEGWDGICVEAHPSFFEHLKKNRKSKCYSCAAGNEDNDTCDFYAHHRASFSSLNVDYWGGKNIPFDNVNGIINGRIKIPMRKLDSILEENNVKKIDLITIDVDGSEKQTLPGLTLNRWNPTLLMLEHTVVGHEYIKNYAENYGYVLGRTCGPDSIFCRDKDDVEIIKNIKVVGTQSEIIHPSDLYFGKKD